MGTGFNSEGYSPPLFKLLPCKRLNVGGNLFLQFIYFSIMLQRTYPAVSSLSVASEVSPRRRPCCRHCWWAVVHQKTVGRPSQSESSHVSLYRWWAPVFAALQTKESLIRSVKEGNYSRREVVGAGGIPLLPSTGNRPTFLCLFLISILCQALRVFLYNSIKLHKNTLIYINKL